MKVLSPFGPKIAKLKLSSKLIKKLNNEVEKIISKKNLVKKLDYSNKLVGQVKQEFQIPKSFIKKKPLVVNENMSASYTAQTLFLRPTSRMARDAFDLPD